MDMLLLLFFPTLMAFAASSDLVTMTIPNRVSLLLIAGFLAMAILVGMEPIEIAKHFAAGGLVLIFTFGFFAAGWIGGGDAKLAAATAIWCGFSVLLDYLVIASVFGGMVTFALLYSRTMLLPMKLLQFPWIARLHDKKTGVPYGIALALAGLTVYPSTQIWVMASSVA